MYLIMGIRIPFLFYFLSLVGVMDRWEGYKIEIEMIDGDV